MEIKNDVYWTGVLDPNLKKFDIILDTKKGSTYNSYLIKGETKIALVDSAKHGFENTFFSNLKKHLTDISQIDYIIVNHTEPDHSAAMAELLDLAPNAIVYASKSAIKFLSAIMNKPFNSVEVDESTSLDLGGKTLRFFKTPFLHWPDTIFTYLKEDQILFTCDAFGAHYCNKNMFNDLCPDYTDQAFYYFDMIVRPFKSKVLQAVEKVTASGIKIDTICPSHGPILRENPMKMVHNYIKWSQPLVQEKDRTVLIMYLSAHTNTKIMAETISKTFINEKVVLLDIAETNMPEIRNELEKAKALFIGSPTVLGDAPYPIWEALAHIPTVPTNIKIAAAFGSYGWSGEAVQKLTNRLKELKLNVFEPGLKINFVASEEENKQIKSFASEIKKILA
ncbi:MAG: hypothetical protein A2Y40_04900 [Candidatus Margulisbacteria bacterium GWF2_35_9]|nr:MAG: hypothetical protein A2Y40_04900 [Candidatus Margulisbacteria bacterium GWF2_35_9]